ncbi:MAG: hypothetical protein KAS39_04630, partial [Actinomycetia bacterium]|nr:hypothetical protein [Actinomycetes bacterium]
MKKAKKLNTIRSLILLINILFLMIYSAHGISEYQPVIDMAKENLEKIPNKNIAVIEFTDITGETNTYSLLITEKIINALVTIKELNLMERSKLSSLINEQKLSVSGLTDETSAIELGKLLNVDALCTGTVYTESGTGSEPEVFVRLIDCKTGKILDSINFIPGKQDQSPESRQRERMNDQIGGLGDGSSGQPDQNEPNRKKRKKGVGRDANADQIKKHLHSLQKNDLIEYRKYLAAVFTVRKIYQHTPD